MSFIRNRLKSPFDWMIFIFLCGMCTMILWAACPTAPYENVKIIIKTGSGPTSLPRSDFCIGEVVTLMANVTCTNATAPPALNYCWSSPTNTMGTNMQTITFTPLTPGIYQATGTVTGVSHFETNNVPFSGTGTNSFMVLKAELDEVTFGGGTTNFFPIFRDGGNAIDAGSQELYTQISPAHWKRGRMRSGMPEPSYPIAYLRNGKMKASAKITITPSSFSGNVKIFGRAQFFNFTNESFNFLFPTNTVQVFGGVANYPMTEVANIPPNSHTGELPSKIDLINIFKLDWKVSCGSSTNFMNAGSSTNQLYVLLKKPIQLPKLFHTLVHVGCKSARGKVGNATVVSNIWENSFKTRLVYRWDDTPPNAFYYYKTPANNCPTFGQFLKTGEGRCGLLAALMDAIILAQGIDGSTTPAVNGLLLPCLWVKKWDFTGVPNHTNTVIKPGYQNGLAGQGVGNINPAQKIFPNHQLVLFGGKLYDPSYGTGPYSNSPGEPALLKWQRANLAAVSTNNAACDNTSTNAGVVNFFDKNTGPAWPPAVH